jgi:hypothetical protein
MLLPAVTNPSPMSCASRGYGVAPAKPPVPFTFMRPVQAAAVAGSHTSNLISESPVGPAARAIPCTRQKPTPAVTVVPDTGPGGRSAAEDMVVESEVTEVSCAQLKAARLAPDTAVSPSASAKPMLLLVPCMNFPCDWLLRPPYGAPGEHSSMLRAIHLK